MTAARFAGADAGDVVGIDLGTTNSCVAIMEGSSARVIDVFDAPIPGLYAAGEVTGGFHGAAYMTGSALGKAVVFGKIFSDRLAEGLRS